MPISVETFNEFATRHGDTHILMQVGKQNIYITDDTGRYLFADGASATLLMLYEPPKEALALLQAKRKYLLTKGKAEAKLFTQHKENYEYDINMHINTGGQTPLPPAIIKEQLAAAKARIEAIAKEVVAIDKEIVEAGGVKQPDSVLHKNAAGQKRYEAIRKGNELLAEVRSL